MTKFLAEKKTVKKKGKTGNAVSRFLEFASVCCVHFSFLSKDQNQSQTVLFVFM